MNGRKLAIVAVVVAIVIEGYFAVEGLIDPGSLVPGAHVLPARIFAQYVAVRSLVLIAALAVFAIGRRWTQLRLLMVINGVVQAGDVVVGFMQGDLLKTVGPAFLALFLLFTARRLRSRDVRGGMRR